jgi:hypothetical protein
VAQDAVGWVLFLADFLFLFSYSLRKKRKDKTKKA